MNSFIVLVGIRLNKRTLKHTWKWFFFSYELVIRTETYEFGFTIDLQWPLSSDTKFKNTHTSPIKNEVHFRENFMRVYNAVIMSEYFND